MTDNLSSTRTSSGPLDSADHAILVVDDDLDVREAIAELLREHGFEVYVAENGHEALAQLRTGRPFRAIILDVGMPVMNGATFRGEQLADARLSSIPLLLLSGRSDITALGSALAASACLRKPFSEEALLHALASSLRGASAEL